MRKARSCGTAADGAASTRRGCVRVAMRGSSRAAGTGLFARANMAGGRCGEGGGRVRFTAGPAAAYIAGWRPDGFGRSRMVRQPRAGGRSALSYGRMTHGRPRRAAPCDVIGRGGAGRVSARWARGVAGDRARRAGGEGGRLLERRYLRGRHPCRAFHIRWQTRPCRSGRTNNKRGTIPQEERHRQGWLVVYTGEAEPQRTKDRGKYGRDHGRHGRQGGT